MSFIVLSLPRSRSAWMARYLTAADWVCGHDELRHMRSLDDVRSWFAQPYTGSAETAAASWWRLLHVFSPGIRVVTIRRPVEEVLDSCMRLQGVAFDREQLERGLRRMDHKLNQLERRLPGVLSVSYADLEREETCAKVFEHCLPYKHDHDRWAYFSRINIQDSVPALMRYYAAYAPQLQTLASIAKHHTIALMSQATAKPTEGLTLQVEDFETWRADGRPLFEEHCVLVGEDPDQWRKKNIPLMQQLNATGALQVTTARSNGRMFGYLMTVISPSLEDVDTTVATNTTFYASPDFPGLGLKLQRKAIEALKARGVDEVMMQTGVRGAGARAGSIYRRLGAGYGGQVYRLSLKEN